VIKEALEIIEIIPGTFWGVIVGSLFSLGGVWLTNKASDQRLKTQFDHERALKTQEREMSLRKDVYLQAAEAVSAGVHALSNFPNLEISNDEVAKAYVEKSPSISRAYVIGSMKTIKALTDFGGELAALMLVLYVERAEILTLKNKVTLLDFQMSGFGKDRDRYLELMRDANINGQRDPQYWKVLNEGFEFEQGRIRSHSQNRDAISKQLALQQFKFMKRCVTESHRMSQCLVPLLIAVREELQLPLDIDGYREILDSSIAKQQVAVDEFVNVFAKKINSEKL
jgi:hypothetical protein